MEPEEKTPEAKEVERIKKLIEENQPPKFGGCSGRVYNQLIKNRRAEAEKKS